MSNVGHRGDPCLLAIERRPVGLQAHGKTDPSAPGKPRTILHGQPMPDVTVTAEEEVGHVSARLVDAVRAAIARAREAEHAGDKGAWEQALADVQKAIGL
jgi:hypothetical protein